MHSNVKGDSYFTKIGGLANHIKVLREILITPLLYGDLYRQFSIKAPRGVIFHGPPGTGKTLLAGALASELNKEGNGKVSFYHRKAADVLDKWLGESEKNLRKLFEKATRNRPSVIFFDEIDGLAPQRSNKNDQVHSSVVATLLALMDGLDNTTGVVVIGATNRIDSIDPALRRAGRFDRELYFPLPDLYARTEILQVHTSSWRYRPSDEFFRTLGEMTSGCCGSDLQAICAEAVLCCLKRNYPSINQEPKLQIDIPNLMVEEEDFLKARINIVPSTQRMCTTKLRRLSPLIRPLLQKQINKISTHLQVLLPQFTNKCQPVLVENERFLGRLLLKGSVHQGLHSHILPALLQTLEHIQCFVLDTPENTVEIFSAATANLPSILVLHGIDDWWDCMDQYSQICFMSSLEGLHAGLPILLICTCSELPQDLHDYFYYKSTIEIRIDDPTDEECERFFAPLFFGPNAMSLYSLWEHQNKAKVKVEKQAILNSEFKVPMRPDRYAKRINMKRAKKLRSNNLRKVAMGRVNKRTDSEGSLSPFTIHGCCKNALNYFQNFGNNGDSGSETRVENRSAKQEHGRLMTAVTELVDCKRIGRTALVRKGSNNLKTFIKRELNTTSSLPELREREKKTSASDSSCREGIYNLWKRVSNVVSLGLTVDQLELLYDTILACINVNQHSFQSVIVGMEETLRKFEATCQGQNNKNT